MSYGFNKAACNSSLQGLFQYMPYMSYYVLFGLVWNAYIQLAFCSLFETITLVFCLFEAFSHFFFTLAIHYQLLMTRSLKQKRIMPFLSVTIWIPFFISCLVKKMFFHLTSSIKVPLLSLTNTFWGFWNFQKCILCHYKA